MAIKEYKEKMDIEEYNEKECDAYNTFLSEMRRTKILFFIKNDLFGRVVTKQHGKGTTRIVITGFQERQGLYARGGTLVGRTWYKSGWLGPIRDINIDESLTSDLPKFRGVIPNDTCTQLPT